ncbi:MAG: PKD domain-containing protein, partial [Saprospiraceae bacterium]
MIKQLPKYFVLLFLLAFCRTANATHIVGGEMFYKCLGDDQYEITLVVFRDCYNGEPPFDNPADIGIYNSAGVLLDSLLIPLDLMLDDTLNPVLANPCLVVPPDVCVHTTTYVDTINLPVIPGGYELIYQRCCRNQTINNIIDPLDTGATYGTSISERALNECNNSAVFNAWPPIYICAGEPIDFDQSAFDPDGDSIVYSLCTPLLGATPGSPEPGAWAQTVPAPVNWESPPYGVNNMLNSDPSDPDVLAIDPVTGFLTGVPDVIGQFVVGICVEEYRDGELISTTRRDFQFNVGVCGQAISSFFTPEVICNNALEVLTENNSDNATNFEWYFNDPAHPDSVVVGSEPSFIYSDTGAYSIMLIAQPGDECVDTSMLDVQLNYYSLGLEFEFEFGECSDTLPIIGTDFSTDSISVINDWYWNITDEFGNLIDFSTEQNPTMEVGTSGPVTMELIVTSENGCVDSLSETFEVNVIDEPMMADSILRCEFDSVRLNQSSLSEYIYLWTPPDYLSDVNVASPWAKPIETTTYSLIIRDSISDCETFRDVTVVLPPPIDLDLTNDTTTCEPTVSLFAQSEIGTGFTWSTDADFDVIIDTLPETTVTPFGEVTYYLEVVDQFRCRIIDSVTIDGNGVNISPQSSPLICLGESTIVSVANLDSTDILTYEWTPLSLITDGADTDSATVAVPSGGATAINILATNQFGCEWLDSVVVNVLDTVSQAAFVASQQCSGYTMQFTNQSVNAPFMIWNFGDNLSTTDTSTLVNPEYTYPGPGTYTVVLAINESVNCPDTVFQDIIVEEPEINVSFNFDYEKCTDTTTVFFTDESTNTQSTIIGWQWIFSTGDTILTQDAAVTVVGSTLLEFELTVFSSDGCDDSFATFLPITLVDHNLVDSILTCPGESTPLNPEPNLDYEYSWSPSTDLNDPLVPNPIASPEMTTTYSVTITAPTVEANCELVREITIVVPPIIDLAVSPDTTVCSGSIDLFANSAQAISYAWSNVPTFSSLLSTNDTITTVPAEPSIYYVRAFDANGCFAEDTITVFGNGVEVTVPNYSICFTDTLEIVPVNLDNEDLLTFEWFPAADIIQVAPNGNATVLAVGASTFTAIATNQNGCKDTIESLVTVYNYVPNIIAEANPDTIFAGDSTQLIVTDSIGYTYEWSPVSTLTNADIYNPIAFPESTTLYEVEVVTPDGCEATARIPVV